MPVYNFIAGLFIGASLGIFLLSLLVAGKQRDISYDMSLGSKVKSILLLIKQGKILY